ncbi:MAG: DUF4468 domain-containing protein [Prevotella sp.]|jgi:hypothetical protein|nr:DUF4468 domain-containing protein [Prevotella sp.]
MKKFLFVLFYLVYINASSQTLPSLDLNPFPYNKESGKIELVGVENSNLKLLSLFRNAKTWATTTKSIYSDESRPYIASIKMEDSATGRIIIECLFTSYSPARYNSPDMTVKSYFDITIDCKDNKYRYKISDYADYMKYGDKEYLKTFETYHDDFKNNNDRKNVLEKKNFFNSIINSLKESMKIDDDF